MTEFDVEHDRPAGSANLGTEADEFRLDLLTDRRRPGRTQVSPVLVPLLRGETNLAAPDFADEDLIESEWDTDEPLKPARGIVYGLLLSLPLWAALLATCHVAIKVMTHS